MVRRSSSCVQCGVEEKVCECSTTSKTDFQLILLILTFCYSHALVPPSLETWYVSVEQIDSFLISVPFSRHFSGGFLHSAKSQPCLLLVLSSENLLAAFVFWCLISLSCFVIHHFMVVRSKRRQPSDKYVTFNRQFLFSSDCTAFKRTSFEIRG